MVTQIIIFRILRNLSEIKMIIFQSETEEIKNQFYDEPLEYVFIKCMAGLKISHDCP